MSRDRENIQWNGSKLVAYLSVNKSDLLLYCTVDIGRKAFGYKCVFSTTVAEFIALINNRWTFILFKLNAEHISNLIYVYICPLGCTISVENYDWVFCVII
jgi:hypothetical protein